MPNLLFKRVNLRPFFLHAWLNLIHFGLEGLKAPQAIPVYHMIHAWKPSSTTYLMQLKRKFSFFLTKLRHYSYIFSHVISPDIGITKFSWNKILFVLNFKYVTKRIIKTTIYFEDGTKQVCYFLFHCVCMSVWECVGGGIKISLFDFCCR